MAQRLAQDPALALLCNTIATGGALVVILLIFGPVSGAHLNPAVTLCMTIARDMSSTLAAGYIGAQIAGGVIGDGQRRVWQSHGAPSPTSTADGREARFRFACAGRPSRYS